MFDSIEILRETAVRMGLVGVPIGDAFAPLEKAYSARVKAARIRYEARKLPLADRLRTVERDRNHVANGPAEIERLRREILPLEVRRAQLSAEIALLQERATGRQRRDAEEHWRTVYGALRTRIEASPRQLLDDELAVARAISDFRRELWTLDRDELQRRRHVLDAELKEVERDIAVAAARVECLKKRHVTKTSSGFMVWAGYTALAAVGAVIGYLLQVDENRPDPLSSAFAAIAGVMAEISDDFLDALGIFLIVTLGSLMLVGGLVKATDWFLGRFFDREWPRGKRGGRRGGKGKDAGPIFQLPRGEVRRGSFVQLVASFPFVFVGALTMFLLGWSGAASPQSIAGGLVSSYFGAAVALLVTAVNVLYVVQVVWPRWLASDTPVSGGRKSILRDNPELAVLLALVPLSFLMTAVMGERWQPERLAWAVVALFMAASSFALAHGIVARGVFKDQEVLESRRRTLLRDIELLSTRPLLGDGIFDDLVAVREQMTRRRQEAEEFDLVSLLYFEPEGGSDDSSSLGELWFWLQRGRMDKKAEERIRALLSRRRRAVPAPFREQDLPEALRLRRELSALEVQISELRALRHRWEAACGPDAERRSDSEWQALKTQLSMIEVEELEQVERLEREHGRQLAELQAAYRLGQLTRPDLGDHLPRVPPPFMGEAQEVAS